MAELQLEKVRKSRPGHDGRPVEILRSVSLTVAGRQLTAIIGPSGGGKSTLVRLLNRLDDPDGGRILFNGEDLSHLDPLLLRRRIALVPQKPFMFSGSVLANLQQSFLFHKLPLPAADSSLVLETLELCRLAPELLPQKAVNLSLGQQQRVALARAVIAAPDILLLDEPTSALDRPTGDRLADTLREICRSRSLSVLMVTHDLRLAARVADRLAYLEAGIIIEEGSADELLTRPRSEQLRRFLAGEESR
jgi:putative ABC transport system ATP-binding protein